jgi:sugar transferase (PEP-CTERM/EpsH1 system associated)
LNILFLAQRVPFPPNKGEKIRTFNQLKYLADTNHQVSVCAPLEHDEDVNYFKTLSEKYCKNISYYPLPNKSVRLFKGLMKGQPLSVANFYSTQLQGIFDSLLATNIFDVIICTSSAMAEYIYQSSIIKRSNTKLRILMDFMDLDSDKWQQYAKTSHWPMKWIYQREAKLLSQYEAKITRDFDCSFFIADAEVQLFKSRVNNTGKVLTLGNGIDTKNFMPATVAPNNTAPVLLFTGVMDYKPNVDAVLWFVEQVWPTILVKYPDAQFIIAGMNPRSSVSELSKMQGITVTGYVDDILPYYHQADYFVAPFRLARGVQNKVLQAFACGLPVIATPMGAEGISCQEDHDILLANSSIEFVERIQCLVQNKALTEQLILNALSLVRQHYSWPGKLQVLAKVLAEKAK